MAHKTLPADIAAAMARLRTCAERAGRLRDQGSVGDHWRQAADKAVVTLEATILRHLRGETEMRDAVVTESIGA